MPRSENGRQAFLLMRCRQFLQLASPAFSLRCRWTPHHPPSCDMDLLVVLKPFGADPEPGLCMFAMTRRMADVTMTGERHTILGRSFNKNRLIIRHAFIRRGCAIFQMKRLHSYLFSTPRDARRRWSMPTPCRIILNSSTTISVGKAFVHLYKKSRMPIHTNIVQEAFISGNVSR